MQICVFGMGKIGLPLAVQYASMGHSVIGVDIDSDRVELINSGIEPFPGETNLQLALQQVLKEGNFSSTIDADKAVQASEVMVVAVPLIVNENSEPDFSALDAVTSKIGRNLKSNDLVIYETTLPIGTTRNRFLIALEKLSGLDCPGDFNLLFSPERVLTGRVFADLKKYPKLVGGITQQCSNRGKIFYESVIEFDSRDDLNKPNGVWILASAEAAEFVKLAETTYRDVNISLANQFSIDSSKLGLDITEIIDAANSQPYSNIHRPGISVGGHCIPVYPLLYLSTNPDAYLIKVARELNDEMPIKALRRIQDVFGELEGKSVAILGVSYRSGVKETAFSGAYKLQSELRIRKAHPFFVDPLFSNEELLELGFDPLKEVSTDIEIVILHTHYEVLIENLLQSFPRCTLLLDGRGLVNPSMLPPQIQLVRI